MIKYFLSLVLLSILISCSTEQTEPAVFRILPSPQKLTWQGSSSISPHSIKESLTKTRLTMSGVKEMIAVEQKQESPLVLKIDSSLEIKSEGYHLKIDQNIINITGRDQAGLLYGLMSVSQLVEDAIEQQVNLPKCEIEDYPLLDYRAIHIDVKHHMEKQDYYYRLMDRLASYKINGVIIEIEDKLKFTRRPGVASPDAVSKEDWRNLSAYAMDRNIEISPLVQGLGHASFILKHPKYKSLRDDPESDWAFNPLDPQTYALQYDLYLDALEAFPHGKYLHIGGDEVHTTGRGSGRSALELQLIWLDKVCRFADEEGKTPIFWDDMPLKHADVYGPMFNREISESAVDSIWLANGSKLEEFIDKFPKNCIYMRWNYQMPETYGNLKAMDWFSSNGFQVMGATAGQTRWSLMPQDQSNMNNIKSFALSSIDKNLDGLLLTLWDDDSPHFELYIRGIMAFAEYTWAGDQRTTEEFKTAFRQRAFGYAVSDRAYDFIDQLEGPVGFWKNALLQEGKSRNNLRKIENPLEEAIIDLPDLSNKGKWTEKHTERLEKVREHMANLDSVSMKIEDALRHADRSEYTLEVYQQVNKLVEFSMSALLKLEQLDLSMEDNEQKALSEVQALSSQFEELRTELEEVYGEARILDKPANYILDQDHHTHNANQSLNFDWQFYPEMLLLQKIQSMK